MEKKQQTVFVLDDDPQVREGLSSLLLSAGLQVSLFDSAEAFLRTALPDGPSCLILDLQLPNISGLELQQRLSQTNGPPIVFISGQGDIPSSVRAMKRGAVEFLTKPFGEKELFDAIQTAFERDRKARQGRTELASLKTLYARLTAREREVLPLIVAGMTNKESANKLHIAQITLQVHRGQIMRKMEAQSVPDLVRMASRLGLS